MDEEFILSVENGFKLSKRLCITKDRSSAAPPKPPPGMSRGGAAGSSLLPSSPMMYAVIADPAIVDNPDVPSYQPHVYGEMDPPALIPLPMNAVAMEIECYVDSALVTVKGSWRVHCVMGSKSCDCRLMLPMGEQGSILGVEVSTSRRSHYTQVIPSDEQHIAEKLPRSKAGGYVKPQMFSLVVPQVSGGSVISLSIRWVQKLLYNDGQFSISIPFTFPDFVIPSGKMTLKKETIKLNVNAGEGREIMCQNSSHLLKEIRRHSGSVGFLYDKEVVRWSRTDFSFSYTIYENDIYGSLLLQSPQLVDTDQREIFSLYLFSGSNHHRKIINKEIIFLIDISESMNGLPLESVITAMSTATSALTPQDSFNIIAFNDEPHSFSPSVTRATSETLEKVVNWMKQECVASGGTNISKALNKAISMLSKTKKTIPHVCIITDGAVEDERNICSDMKARVNSKPFAPGISTFGIGSYCNHYFLRQLASIGKGQYDAAFEAGSIVPRLERFFKRITSPILTKITLDFLDSGLFEMYPSHVPDLSAGNPLLLVGRCNGKFPEVVTVKGFVADMTEFSIELRTQKTEISLDKIFAKHQIGLMTAEAWFSGNRELEQKIMELSIHSGITSEYTLMVLRKEEEKEEQLPKGKKATIDRQKSKAKEKPILVQGLGLGFGDVTATAENLPTGLGGESPEMEIEVVAKKCCGRVADLLCCMCCIRACSKMNDQVMILTAQVVTGLSVLGCMVCCSKCGDSE